MVKAVLKLADKSPLRHGARVQLVAWQVPKPLRGSRHNYKYRFALIVNDVCVMRYDNEAGKGDHRHVGNREFPYDFVGLERARHDFMAEAEAWVRRHLDG
ncbi:MAG: toxin-antitoxin system TumE family protein [Devosia sp.]